MFAFHRNVVVENGGAIARDVSVFLGDVRVYEGASIAGDVTAIVGEVRRQPQASITGSVGSTGRGKGWLLLVILPPLVFLG